MLNIKGNAQREVSKSEEAGRVFWGGGAQPETLRAQVEMAMRWQLKEPPCYPLHLGSRSR